MFKATCCNVFTGGGFSYLTFIISKRGLSTTLSCFTHETLILLIVLRISFYGEFLISSRVRVLSLPSFFLHNVILVGLKVTTTSSSVILIWNACVQDWSQVHMYKSQDSNHCTINMTIFKYFGIDYFIFFTRYHSTPT